MVTAEDMGNTSVEISALGFMPSEYSEKTGSYHEFFLLLGHSDLDTLTIAFNDNWASSPVEVFSNPQLQMTGVAGGEWLMFEFDQPFFYNGSSNLLCELSWEGPVDPPDSRIYTMNWDAEESCALVAFSPDSSRGYLSSAVPNLLFVTAQALETQTFAGIKSSF